MNTLLKNTVTLAGLMIMLCMSSLVQAQVVTTTTTTLAPAPSTTHDCGTVICKGSDGGYPNPVYDKFMCPVSCTSYGVDDCCPDAMKKRCGPQTGNPQSINCTIIPKAPAMNPATNPATNPAMIHP